MTTTTSVLARPALNYADIDSALSATGQRSERPAPAVVEQVETTVKYQGYIDRQQTEIEKLRRQEHTPIPDDFSYRDIAGLSNELRQKLDEHRPDTVGRAARIPGVTPAAVSLLLVYLKKHQAAAAPLAQASAGHA